VGEQLIPTPPEDLTGHAGGVLLFSKLPTCTINIGYNENMSHKPYSLIFWIHSAVNLLFLFSWLLFSWWIVLFGQVILFLQYKIFGGCVLSKIEFKDDTAWIPYYLHRWKLIKDREKCLVFTRNHMSVVVAGLVLVLHFVFGFKPLIF